MAILLLFLIQAALTSADMRAVDLQREKATLLALKQGLTLPSSAAALADWNETNSNVCSFTGVTCDWRREHVVGLSLANMGIRGAIPPVIGELSHLRSLDVSNNNISGPVTASIGNLTRLQSLFMNNNGISGAIPSISKDRKWRRGSEWEPQISFEIFDYCSKITVKHKRVPKLKIPTPTSDESI
jgi:hypothetical protein